jgi:two-component system chemotaxis response regulator CheY
MSSREPPKVLIVDDNDVMRTLLRGILRNEEFLIVGEARTGVGAIEMAERLRPNLICLDVVMPEMDGIAALQEIKRKHPEIVIIMITGNASKENVQEALEYGAAGFVVKPFNAATVLETINRAWHLLEHKKPPPGTAG